MVCYIAVMLRLFLVVLLSLVAVVLTSCDSGTLNPPPEGYDPEGRCSAGKNQILPEEEWDSLQARCDTVFIRDTVIVYGDTAYDDMRKKFSGLCERYGFDAPVQPQVLEQYRIWNTKR